MNTNTIDPIKRTAELINSVSSSSSLERRLKQDILASIERIKPDAVKNIDFEHDVMSGEFFEQLSAPLQGIAIARCEGALAFYNRVGWRDEYLSTPLPTCVPQEAIETLSNKYHATTLHDLSYVHPKHFEKIMGKTETASLWETLKRFSKAS